MNSFSLPQIRAILLSLGFQKTVIIDDTNSQFQKQEVIADKQKDQVRFCNVIPERDFLNLGVWLAAWIYLCYC